MIFMYSRDFLHPVTVQADYAHRHGQDRELALQGPRIWTEGPIQLAMRAASSKLFRSGSGGDHPEAKYYSTLAPVATATAGD